MPNVKIYKTNVLPSSGMEADAIYLVKDGTAFFMYVRNNDNSAWGELKVNETDPIWTAEKGDYVKNTPESSTFAVSTGKGLFIGGSGDTPAAGAFHGIYIPHTGGLSTYGSELALRNNAFYFRSKEASTTVWNSWLRVADRQWVLDQGYLSSVPTLEQVLTAGNISNNYAHFRFRQLAWYQDFSGNNRIYFGDGSGANGIIFQISTATENFQFSNCNIRLRRRISCP